MEGCSGVQAAETSPRMSVIGAKLRPKGLYGGRERRSSEIDLLVQQSQIVVRPMRGVLAVDVWRSGINGRKRGPAPVVNTFWTERNRL